MFVCLLFTAGLFLLATRGGVQVEVIAACPVTSDRLRHLLPQRLPRDLGEHLLDAHVVFCRRFEVGNVLRGGERLRIYKKSLNFVIYKQLILT